MRDGNCSGDTRDDFLAACLNEGWPECGMETKQAGCGNEPIERLNEGWPECGMETKQRRHYIVQKSQSE